MCNFIMITIIILQSEKRATFSKALCHLINPILLLKKFSGRKTIGIFYKGDFNG